MRRFLPVFTLASLAAAVIAAHTNQASAEDANAKQDSVVYELRTYTTAPGRLPALHKRFSEHTMRIFEKHGIRNVAYWTPTDEKLKDNTLVYVIAHASRDAAKKSWDDFRKDPAWKKVAKESQVGGKILAKRPESVYLSPTEYSPKLGKENKGSDAKPRVFELRTYTTAEGKLPELHKRFSDHTIKLFAKHGMQNVIYWTPADKKNTLVYLVSHASEKAAKKSWSGFGKDPVWRKAFAASRKDGPLVVKVQRQYLTPTDYSPRK